MKTRRVELRVDARLRQQLDDLAADMHCGISEVIRRLVTAEHGKRFAKAIVTASVPAAERQAAPVALEQADAATRIFIEMGFPPEDFGIAG